MTIEELKSKENWTEEDYQYSLELLRDDNALANKIYLELNSELFYTILDFEAGWSEKFWSLPEAERIKYKQVFTSLK